MKGKRNFRKRTDRLPGRSEATIPEFVTNEYFLDHPERIIHTEAKRDTDPYGKPP